MERTRIARALALVVVLGGAVMLWRAAQADDDTLVAEPAVAEDAPAPTSGPEPTAPPEPIPVLGEAADLVQLDGWLNTDATSFAEAQGTITIVQFWTFGCHNCKATIPHLQEIYAAHHDSGLEIIGVHAPEFDYEADVGNIVAAAEDLGVVWPIALDTDKVNFRTWQEGGRRYWPRTYVIDHNGQIRFDKIGEGAYSRLASTVAQLLDEANRAA